MAKTFVTSDSHWGHKNICLKFTDSDGKRVRPFDSVEEMDEFMIRRWNETVNPEDTVWHLGDFDFYHNTSKTQNIVNRLNGKIRLIMGNHDYFHKSGDAKKLIDIFGGVYQWNMLSVKGQIHVLSHFPLHRSTFDYVAADGTQSNAINVHGHIHQRLINEPGYLNVGVELTEYRPVDINDLPKLYMKQQNPNYRRPITKEELARSIIK